jgi:hypothetical protein
MTVSTADGDTGTITGGAGAALITTSGAGDSLGAFGAG